MIEKLDIFGCTIVTDEDRSVNVLNDRVAVQMFEKINEIIDYLNKQNKA